MNQGFSLCKKTVHGSLKKGALFQREGCTLSFERMHPPGKKVGVNKCKH